MALWIMSAFQISSLWEIKVIASLMLDAVHILLSQIQKGILDIKIQVKYVHLRIQKLEWNNLWL